MLININLIIFGIGWLFSSLVINGRWLKLLIFTVAKEGNQSSIGTIGCSLSYIHSFIHSFGASQSKNDYVMSFWKIWDLIWFSLIIHSMQIDFLLLMRSDCFATSKCLTSLNVFVKLLQKFQNFWFNKLFYAIVNTCKKCQSCN